ncbi:MAG: histidine--tRNA ligase [Gammaproteobacteria bacterium]|nr:MAG: histidine--tRNA ligase [Gammaproteobacteria bacterium]
MKGKKQFQSIRGMRDLSGQEARYFEYLCAVMQQYLHSHGYQPFHPPILENTQLFSRSIGEGTDVVEKEMFTFDDHGDSLTMRPEGTAGIVRAVIENGLTFGTHKLWTAGPMFRRERPQKGRYRQFYQFSVEAFGIAEPEQDAEQLLMMADLWQTLGVAEHVKLHINSLATAEVRDNYRQALIDYFSAHADKLDSDSQRRLHKNPLRILDSKNPKMQAVIGNAPKLSEYWDSVSEQHFKRVLACLQAAGVKYSIDDTLVRGLDYYNHTVYEWVTDQLGAQGTLCGGGRYDGLCEYIGGKATPAVGFGLGIDRTVLLMQAVSMLPETKPLAYFVLLGQAAKCQGLLLANQLRRALPQRQVITHLADSGMKTQFKKADQSRAEYAVIIGAEELAGQQVSIKNLAEGSQQTVAFADLIHFFNHQQ